MAYIFQDLEVNTLYYFRVAASKIWKAKERKEVNMPWGPFCVVGALFIISI